MLLNISYNGLVRHKVDDENYLNLKVVQRKGLGEQKSSELIHDTVGWKPALYQ